MVVFLSESLYQMVKISKAEMNEQTFLKNLLLRFTTVVTHLTEKSVSLDFQLRPLVEQEAHSVCVQQPFQISKAFPAFNRLVYLLIEIGTACLADLKSCGLETNQRTLVETLRAIGSLVYANGSCLNEDNLRLLLGDDRSLVKDQSYPPGLLASIRVSIEQEIPSGRCHGNQINRNF